MSISILSNMKINQLLVVRVRFTILIGKGNVLDPNQKFVTGLTEFIINTICCLNTDGLIIHVDWAMKWLP